MLERKIFAVPSSEPITINSKQPLVAYSESGNALYARTDAKASQAAGVVGIGTAAGYGVYGRSTGGDGVHGEASAENLSGVAGINTGAGKGVYGYSASGPAGYFDGPVTVAGQLTVFGDILLPNGGDCAERFDVRSEQDAEPGTLMVIGLDGRVAPCDRAYDTRIAGVVAGAGSYRPAIILDDAPPALGAIRAKIALFGKVFCKVDATKVPISAGDLLTTSSSRGHAMRATDPHRRTGSIVGKALAPLPGGKGTIPILVTLQ